MSWYFYRNYAPTIKIQMEALQSHNCQQVVWLYGPEHRITEVGAMNVFMFWTNENGGVFLLFFLTFDCLQGSHSHESQGKSWKNLWSWKVMEKSWKITKISKVMEKQKFYPNLHQNIVRYMMFLKIVQRWISSEKFARISTSETVIEIANITLFEFKI